MRSIYILLSLIPLFASCQKDSLYKSGDYFFIENDEAFMPVWVRGNINSNVFIIHLHGGPGGSSIVEAEQKVYFALETDYAMVYWDQRGSGCSQGKTQPESMTMDQFVEDLEHLIAVLNSKYEHPTLFLHGHSWGGALGTAFLIKNNNQSLIKGWIELDGAHHFRLGLEKSVQWVKTYAQNEINNGTNVTFWQNVLTWYSTNPIMITTEQMKQHCEVYLNAANGYIYNPNNHNLSLFIGGDLNSPGGYSNGDFAQVHLAEELQNGYSDKMYKITIPSLILWGKHDGIMPVEMAMDAYNHLGTDSIHKEIYIFENSAHSPNREEPSLFIEKIKMFIEKYK